MSVSTVRSSPFLATRTSHAPAPILKLLAAPLHALLSIKFGSFQWKYLAYFMFLVNIKSAPFAWHLRICRILVSYQIRKSLLQMNLLYRYPLCPQIRRDKFNDWFDSNISPVGLDPFRSIVAYSSRATFDDCDLNCHLSNSCYGKVFDHARIKAAIKFFPNFFCVGGWFPLGATHYHFMREIPIFARYEVRVSILTWDSKWAFMVGRFVTKRKSRSGSRVKGAYAEIPGWEALKINSKELSPEDKSALAKSIAAGYTSPIEALKLLAASGRFEDQDDDAIIHCIALSQVCFKIGRVTIPPALVFASDGMTTATSLPPSPSHVRSSLATNVPPHWDHVRKLRLDKEGFVKLLTGGWRGIPEGERWWEDAFRGEGEARRLANLQVLEIIRKGMDAIGTM